MLPRILLEDEVVPSGARVHLYMPSSEAPVAREGQPLVFRRFLVSPQMDMGYTVITQTDQSPFANLLMIQTMLDFLLLKFIHRKMLQLAKDMLCLKMVKLDM